MARRREGERERERGRGRRETKFNSGLHSLRKRRLRLPAGVRDVGGRGERATAQLPSQEVLSRGKQGSLFCEREEGERRERGGREEGERRKRGERGGREEKIQK